MLQTMSPENDLLFQRFISNAIGKFAHDYGFDNKFKEQSSFYKSYIEKFPNNGYRRNIYSTNNSESIYWNNGAEDENLFLGSWQTDLVNLEVIFAERFRQIGEPCWFVVYLVVIADHLYLVSVKYWEDRVPQVNIVHRSEQWT